MPCLQIFRNICLNGYLRNKYALMPEAADPSILAHVLVKRANAKSAFALSLMKRKSRIRNPYSFGLCGFQSVRNYEVWVYLFIGPLSKRSIYASFDHFFDCGIQYCRFIIFYCTLIPNMCQVVSAALFCLCSMPTNFLVIISNRKIFSSAFGNHSLPKSPLPMDIFVFHCAPLRKQLPSFLEFVIIKIAIYFFIKKT